MSDANISALGALATSLNATANNLANANTQGYKAVRVRMREQAGGGVTATVDRDQTPGPPLAAEPGSPAESMGSESNVDIVRETVNLIVTSQAYGANARAWHDLEETRGRVLDLLK